MSSMFEKAKDLAGQHPDQVKQGIDRAGDMVDERTGGAHAGQVDQAQDAAGRHLGLPGQDADPAQEGEAPPPADQQP